MNKKELLQKLRALAERGEGGEKINAQRKLEELMRKYNISESGLEAETDIPCEFTYHGAREKQLLVQIIYKVLNDKGRTYGFRYTYSGRACKSKLGCEATPAQKIEIEFLFDFYKQLYKQEEEFFFSAFIQKHRLFGDLKDGEKPQKQSLEESMRMNTLMDGMREETPVKRLQGGYSEQ